MYIMRFYWRKQWQSHLWSSQKPRVDVSTIAIDLFTVWIRAPDGTSDEIPTKDLPSCRQCQSLVRPHVVWFGESLWPGTMDQIHEELNRCDLFLVVRLYKISFFISFIFTKLIEGRNIGHCLSSCSFGFSGCSHWYSSSGSEYWNDSYDFRCHVSRSFSSCGILSMVRCRFHFQGPAGEVIPKLLSATDDSV